MSAPIVDDRWKYILLRADGTSAYPPSEGFMSSETFPGLAKNEAVEAVLVDTASLFVIKLRWGGIQVFIRKDLLE